MTDWMKDLFPIITAFGGLFAGHWLTSKSKRKDNLDDWWERYAITEGVEPVINYVSLLIHRIRRHEGYLFDGLPQKQPLPLLAINRLTAISGSARLSELLILGEVVAEHGTPDELEISEYSDTLDHVLYLLQIMQAALLNTHIKFKGDILSIHEKCIDIKNITQLIDELISKKTPISPDYFPEALKEKVLKNRAERQELEVAIIELRKEFPSQFN